MFVFVLLVSSIILSSCAEPERYRDIESRIRAELEQLDSFMGNWQGIWRLDDGSDSGPVAAQVIALGQGQYRVKFIEEFDFRVPVIAELEGRLDEAKVSFSGPARYEGNEFALQANLERDRLSGSFRGQDFSGTFTLQKVIRLSPTLGAKPPKAALVLFDGKNLDGWTHSPDQSRPVQWKIVDGAMEVVPGTSTIRTKKEFADVKLHLEFRTPFMPQARGQGRGNSGVYLQGRYEVQVLDSFGLEGRDNECGGIYGASAPAVNVCAPPMQWQTYDITFRAARFGSNKQKLEDARMTVLHNGVKIHDNIPLTRIVQESPGSDLLQWGGIYLQDHGNPVQYRNIWAVELPRMKNSR